MLAYQHIHTTLYGTKSVRDLNSLKRLWTDLYTFTYMQRDGRDRKAKEIQIRECMAHKSYIYHKHISFAGVRDSGLCLWRCEWSVSLSVC